MVKPHHIYETMGSVSSPRKSSEEHFGVVAMVSHLAERVQETLARAVPLVFLVCGLLWLLVLVVRSSLFPPFFLITLAGITWGKRVMVSLRERGGPISLLPRWARSLLTETRPLDAMSAMALVVDAQKGIGLCVHFLAALRLDEAERATFVEQLPTRLREFVLAPGLLQLVPQSVRALIAWDEPVGGVLLGPPEEILSDLNVVEEPGDAPRADPSFNDDDASSSSEEEDFAFYEEEPSTQSRRRRPSFPQDIGALTNGFIAHSDENLGGPRAAATTRESSSAASSSSDRGSEDDDDTTTNDDNKVAASGAGAVFAHMRENLRNFLRSARRATPIASVRSASSGFLDSLVEVAKTGLLATLRKKTRKRKTKRVRRRQKREAPQSVVRAVAEFNPWPTLLRVVSRRAATWLREQLTVTTLTTTSIAAAAALSAQSHCPRPRGASPPTPRDWEALSWRRPPSRRPSPPSALSTPTPSSTPWPSPARPPSRPGIIPKQNGPSKSHTTPRENARTSESKTSSSSTTPKTTTTTTTTRKMMRVGGQGTTKMMTTTTTNRPCRNRP